MDTQKLLAITNDIIQDHESRGLSGLLNDLRARITENTPEAFQQADQIREQLSAIFIESPVNDYTPSYTRIMNSIGALGLVGADGKNRLDAIFNGSSLQLQPALEKYVNDYSAFIDKIIRSRDGLNGLGIKPFVRDAFEIGLSVPNTIDDLQEVSKKLKIWDRFLVLCSEIAGDEDTVTRLSRLNNGSHEFFVFKDLPVANIVDFTLAHAYLLYMGMKKIQKTQLDVENLEIDQEIKKKTLQDLKEAEIKKQEEFTQEITTSLFTKSYRGKAERKEELEGQYGVAFKVVLKYMQEGVEAEVGTPPPTGEDAQEAKKVEEVVAHTRQLKQLYAEPLETRQLAFEVKVTEVEANRIGAKPRGSSSPKAPGGNTTAKEAKSGA